MLQARGDIHRVAPNVVEGLIDADHAGEDVACVNSNPDVDLDAEIVAQARNCADNIQPGHDGAIHMIELRMRQAGDREIAVSDRLYFLQSMTLHDAIEDAKNSIQEGDDVSARSDPAQRP